MNGEVRPLTRVVTALVILPLALAGVYLLSGWSFLLFVTLVVELAVWEYATLTSRLAGPGVMRSLLLLVPLAVLVLGPTALAEGASTTTRAVAFGTLVFVGSGVVALWSRRSLEQTTMAIGLLAFGVAYFAVPIAALHQLREMGPWHVLLVAFVVWAGDSAAFFVGSRWGRRKLAPVVSPNKTWEGAAASLVAALGVGAAWAVWRLGSLDLELLLATGLTSCAAQVGDLVESSFKRRLGIKDSSTLLPGHGGMLDRLDSLLFAAPALVLVLWGLGWDLP